MQNRLAFMFIYGLYWYLVNCRLVLQWQYSKNGRQRHTKSNKSCCRAYSIQVNRAFHPMRLLKPFRQAHIIWSAIGIALLLATSMLVWRAIADEKAEAANTGDVAGGKVEQVSASTSQQKTRKHSHMLSPALQLAGPQYLEMHDRWFESPAMAGPQRFAMTATPLSVDSSCTRRAEMQHPTLESSIRSTIGVDTTQLIPLDALVQQASQFWQHDGWYYQLSARWEKDIPATYTLEHYRTRQADFQGVVERLPMTNSEPMDALGLAARIDETLVAAESRGAVRGARLVHLLIGGEDGDALQDLKISNGRPIAWMFGYGHCRTRSDSTAFCRCVDPATASKEAKDEHSVID
jgi:hypothetical protein